MSERSASQEPRVAVSIAKNGHEVEIVPNGAAWRELDNLAWRQFARSRVTREQFFRKLFKNRRNGFEKMERWDINEAIGHMVVEALRLEQLLAANMLIVRQRETVTRTRTVYRDLISP